MRMRRKKNLDERLEKCGDMIYRMDRESKDFSDKSNKELIDLEKLFGRNAPLILEIGCGKGQFAAELPFSSSGYISGVSGFDFHITNDNVLCMEYDGHKKAIANVDSYVAARAGSDGKTVYVYFVTNDGMLWSYSFGTQEAIALVNRSVIQPVLPDGDVNGDGKFDVADAVLLQKWLLGVPDTHLVHWKAGDLCNDNKLDVYDFCAMKSELANSRS